MATLSIRVSTTNDDGGKQGSRAWSTSSIWLGYDSYWGQNIGMFRFNNVTIPQGATITSAKITIKAAGENNNPFALRVYGIDEDDTANFSSDPTGRTKTTAYVDWSPSGFLDETTYDTPNIATVVKEIVDRAGWASGNDIGFFITNTSTTNREVNIYDYSDNASYSALLTVEYVDGGSPSPSLSPSLSPSRSSSVSASLSASLSASSTPSPSPSPGDEYGFKISKPGYDVRTETDLENLVFTSGKGALGWRSTQTVTATTDANGKIETTHAHNLGYVPMAFVYVINRASQQIACPNKWETEYSETEVMEENFYFYVDDTYVYLKAYAHHYEPTQGGSDTNLANQQYSFKVVIYFNELNDE